MWITTQIMISVILQYIFMISKKYFGVAFCLMYLKVPKMEILCGIKNIVYTDLKKKKGWGVNLSEIVQFCMKFIIKVVKYCIIS